MDKAALFNWIYIIGLMAVMYFLMIRPQQLQAKKKKELVESLRAKDKIVTSGGIYGTITRVKDESVLVKIAENVEIELLRTAVMSKKER